MRGEAFRYCCISRCPLRRPCTLEVHSRRHDPTPKDCKNRSAYLLALKKAENQTRRRRGAARIINIQVQTAAGRRFPVRVAQARLLDRAQSPRQISELPLGRAAPALAANAWACIQQTTRHSQSQLQEYSPRVSKAM